MTEIDKTLVSFISFPSFRATEMEQQSCQASLPFLDLFLKNRWVKKEFPQKGNSHVLPSGISFSSFNNTSTESDMQQSRIHALCCRNTKIKCSFQTLQNIYIEIALSS